MEAPLGIVVEVTRKALTAPCVSAATYDAAVFLFECRFYRSHYPLLGRMRVLPHCPQSLICS
jgi:hypothetical protein